MRILTLPQMICAEQQSEKLGVSLSQLMDNAGAALADEIAAQCKRLGENAPLILAGKGNNGGDGLAAAGLLAERGLSPVVMLCCGEPDTPLAKERFAALDKRVKVISYTPEQDAAIEDARLICDCIFGTGFKGDLPDSIGPLFASISTSDAFVIACDIPSGADARSGNADPLAVKADLTLTMHAVKLGMTLSPARHLCGEIKTADIGIPEDVYSTDVLFNSVTTLSSKAEIPRLLPDRLPWGHKGTFGRLLCVCGSERYIGAAALSCEAAMRCGVGLTELLSAERCINSISPTNPEIIYTTLTGHEASDIFRQRRTDCDAVLIGCGIGTDEQAKELLYDAVLDSEKPVVIDADGINLLSENINILLKKKADIILTPHPAELARLCGVTTDKVLSDRLYYASMLADSFGVTVVSKAAETIVTNGRYSTVIHTGSTALSKAGSGDMLAGAIASLTAQRPQLPFNNAVLGCYIIGESAASLSQEMSERGVIARDILARIPKTLRAFETM